MGVCNTSRLQLLSKLLKRTASQTVSVTYPYRSTHPHMMRRIASRLDWTLCFACEPPNLPNEDVVLYHRGVSTIGLVVPRHEACLAEGVRLMISFNVRRVSLVRHA